MLTKIQDYTKQPSTITPNDTKRTMSEILFFIDIIHHPEYGLSRIEELFTEQMMELSQIRMHSFSMLKSDSLQIRDNRSPTDRENNYSQFVSMEIFNRFNIFNFNASMIIIIICKNDSNFSQEPILWNKFLLLSDKNRDKTELDSCDQKYRMLMSIAKNSRLRIAYCTTRFEGTVPVVISIVMNSNGSDQSSLIHKLINFHESLKIFSPLPKELGADRDHDDNGHDDGDDDTLQIENARLNSTKQNNAEFAVNSPGASRTLFQFICFTLLFLFSLSVLFCVGYLPVHSTSQFHSVPFSILSNILSFTFTIFLTPIERTSKSIVVMLWAALFLLLLTTGIIVTKCAFVHKTHKSCFKDDATNSLPKANNTLTTKQLDHSSVSDVISARPRIRLSLLRQINIFKSIVNDLSKNSSTPTEVEVRKHAHHSPSVGDIKVLNVFANNQVESLVEELLDLLRSNNRSIQFILSVFQTVPSYFLSLYCSFQQLLTLYSSGFSFSCSSILSSISSTFAFLSSYSSSSSCSVFHLLDPFETLPSVPLCHRINRYSNVRLTTGARRGLSLQSILIALLLLSGHILSVNAMLDALKALFILTGASTYLVTKNLNITANRTSDFYGLQPYGFLHPNGTQYFNLNNSRHLSYKGESLPDMSLVRPMYVLTLDEEEDEKQLPKLLLKLSLSSQQASSPSSSSSSLLYNKNEQHNSIEYILDAKMEDFGPVRENFAVNKTNGELFLMRPLNRDPPNGRASWKFSVQARNKRTQLVLAVADVLITVRDINDNAPLFEQKIYQTTLIENGPAGQILTKVTAIDFDDADTADNGKVMYSLVKSTFTTPGAASLFRKKSTTSSNTGQMGGGTGSGNQASSSIRQANSIGGNAISITDYFQIDPHTGVLTALACCFDREKRSNYTLHVMATDAFGLSDQATIEVSIIDVNDSPPKFIANNRTLTLQYASLHNTVWIDQTVHDTGSASRNKNHDHVQGHNHGAANNNDRMLFDDGTAEELITTLLVHDDDLPQTNRLSFELVNATNCSLFHKFYVVTNDDGNGTLFGKRARLTEPLELNRTYTCELLISVQDTVRENDQSEGKIFEDFATIRLVYRNTSQVQESKRVEQTSNAASVISDNGKSDFELVKASTDDGLKAFDLTAKRASSDCNLCQNGGQCIVTDTSFRFRCFCSSGFEGALCERSVSRSFQLEHLLTVISTNQLLFYGTIIIIVNLLVVVLGLMVWAIKRVKSTHPSPSQSESNLEQAVLSPPLVQKICPGHPSSHTDSLDPGPESLIGYELSSLGPGTVAASGGQMVDTAGFLHLELTNLQTQTSPFTSHHLQAKHLPTSQQSQHLQQQQQHQQQQYCQNQQNLQHLHLTTEQSGHQQQQQPSPIPLLQSPLMINCTIIDSGEYGEQKGQIEYMIA